MRRIRALKETTTPGRRLGTATAVSQAINGFSLSLVERNTPALFGAGRIDEIPLDVLVAVAAMQPTDVRGRVSRTQDGRFGRFGWKAQIPSLHEFVRGACANELGLEVPGHSQPSSPVAPKQKAKGLDLTEADCDALAAYVRSLPAPVVVDPYGPRGTPDMREGRRLFTEAECVLCHTPTIGEVGGIYSDLLLHNMGQSLSDSGSTYGMNGPDTPTGPSPREWRTPPLWGYRDSGPYLHDGRARNLEEAVALHEGQAKASAKRFFALSARERSQVESFLKSLVARLGGTRNRAGGRAGIPTRQGNARQARTRIGVGCPPATRGGCEPGSAEMARLRSAPAFNSPSPGTWKRWARPRPRSALTARSHRRRPTRTRGGGPSRGSPSSPRGRTLHE